jgi:hypothetical protein
LILLDLFGTEVSTTNFEAVSEEVNLANLNL